MATPTHKPPNHIKQAMEKVLTRVYCDVGDQLAHVWDTAYENGYNNGWDKGYADHKADVEMNREVNRER